MQIYLVGGYVRDRFLRQELHYEIPEGDRDWVVVGSTAEEMIRNGFIPVGKDFPVFLHPQTHEEYALARTERKIAPGYHGFTFYASPEVTLNQDLQRRDLTINAIAMQEERIFDPYGGLLDIKKKILRHVSKAFQEDPVRVLRVARFAAKLCEFSIAPETLKLMKQMVANGETDALVPERVFAEMRKALNYPYFDRFIHVLNECGLGETLFNGLNIDESVLSKIHSAHDLRFKECQKIAILTTNASSIEAIEFFFKKIKPSAEIMDLCRQWYLHQNAFQTHPELMLNLFEKADAFRRPQRFSLLLQVAQLSLGLEPCIWEKALEAATKVNCANIAKNCTNRQQIPFVIHNERLKAIQES